MEGGGGDSGVLGLTSGAVRLVAVSAWTVGLVEVSAWTVGLAADTEVMGLAAPIVATLGQSVCVAEEMEVVLLAREMEVVLLAGEMDLVAGLDFLAGAGAKQNDGKANRVIRGGTLTLRSIRATMTAGEGDAGPGDDGAGLGDGEAEDSRSRWLVAFHRRKLFIIFSS